MPLLAPVTSAVELFIESTVPPAERPIQEQPIPGTQEVTNGDTGAGPFPAGPAGGSAPRRRRPALRSAPAYARPAPRGGRRPGQHVRGLLRTARAGERP